MSETKESVKKKIEKTIEEGGVLALLYFDVHGKDEDEVKHIATGFVNHLINKPGVVMALGEIDKPIPGDEKNRMWSSSVEVKILTKSFTDLLKICMENSPFAIEILRPDKIKLELGEAHEVLSLASSMSAEYKRYIITKLSTPEQLAKYQAAMQRKAELGKALLEKKSENKEEGG